MVSSIVKNVKFSIDKELDINGKNILDSVDTKGTHYYCKEELLPKEIRVTVNVKIAHSEKTALCNLARRRWIRENFTRFDSFEIFPIICEYFNENS